jgi:hypothetical protein
MPEVYFPTYKKMQDNIEPRRKEIATTNNFEVHRRGRKINNTIDKKYLFGAQLSTNAISRRTWGWGRGEGGYNCIGVTSLSHVTCTVCNEPWNYRVRSFRHGLGPYRIICHIIKRFAVLYYFLAILPTNNFHHSLYI